MNIEENYEFDQELNALTAMEGCMNHIAETFLLPNEENLTEEQVRLFGIIGLTLHTIAQKAYAFEKLQNGENHEDSVN